MEKIASPTNAEKQGGGSKNSLTENDLFKNELLESILTGNDFGTNNALVNDLLGDALKGEGDNGEITVQETSTTGATILLENTIYLYNDGRLSPAELCTLEENISFQVSMIANGQRFGGVSGPLGDKNIRINTFVDIVLVKDEAEGLAMVAQDPKGILIRATNSRSLLPFTDAMQNEVNTGAYSGGSFIIRKGAGAGWQGQFDINPVGAVTYEFAHEWLHTFGLQDRYLLAVSKPKPLEPTSAENAETVFLAPVHIAKDQNYHTPKYPNIMVNGNNNFLSAGQVSFLYNRVEGENDPKDRDQVLKAVVQPGQITGEGKEKKDGFEPLPFAQGVVISTFDLNDRFKEIDFEKLDKSNFYGNSDDLSSKKEAFNNLSPFLQGRVREYLQDL